MMDHLLKLDKEVFITLNSFHTDWLDPIMYVLSNTLTWTPLFALLLYLIYKVHGRQTWIYLIGITLTIVLADQVTSSVMKPFFERLRPTHEPSLAGVVHIVNDYRGGQFGFASSHAANTFGCALFIFLLLRRTFAWIALIFLWAFFVSYTRIYLGVHYPGDLIAGGLVGMFFAVINYLWCRRVDLHMLRSKEKFS